MFLDIHLPGPRQNFARTLETRTPHVVLVPLGADLVVQVYAEPPHRTIGPGRGPNVPL